MDTVSQKIADFVSETTEYLEQLDRLPLSTAMDLYDMLEAASKSATANRKTIDPELRVEICSRQDEVLERIIDFSPTFKVSENHRICTPAVQSYRQWQNVELMKDKGLVGYTLAKEVSAQSMMYFGTETQDYPYLSVLPGMEMLYNNSELGLADAYDHYLHENYRNMDTMILHGMYNETIGYLEAYSRLRPDGKVYCGLDMNSYWMGNINWNSEAVMKFAAQCDYIATSCRAMRDALNRNPDVPFSCHWFPNAFYNPAGSPTIAEPERKENIILSVGRIGTQVKNNTELLIAFAKAAQSMPGWQLRFVGAVEPDFQALVRQIFSLRPDLESRVVFTGQIADKEELYKEYERAKIFALTSLSEGGTPNVYAEALFHGCMFVTSSIDAADDVTNHGELGVKYQSGSTDELASSLLEISHKAHRRGFADHISKALAYGRKHYDWNRNAKKLAYMLYKDCLDSFQGT